MNEQISLGGTPVIGFGGEADEKKFYTVELRRPIIGFFVGAIAGALVGNYVKKGVGTAVGTIVGGAGGILLGGWKMPRHDETSPAQAQKKEDAWRRVRPTDTPKAGQEFASAIARRDRQPLPKEELASVDSMINMLNSSGVMKVTGVYMPGAALPADWPKDDNLGPTAFRIAYRTFVDSPNAIGGLFDHLSSDTYETLLWVRDSAQVMRPGETWTAKAKINPLKPWPDNSDVLSAIKGAVELALQKAGIKGMDGDWDGDPDKTFTIAVTPAAAMAVLSEVPIASEWADKITFSDFAWAPVQPVS